MPNAANGHMATALERPGCAVCAALAEDEARWMEAYWREAMFDDAARARFFDAGGFCHHHAWVLHRQAKAEGYGSAISFLYGNLARRDSDVLARGKAKLLRRKARCRACTVMDETVERKAGFLVEVLEEQELRERYAAGDGLCYAHLALTAERAGKGVAAFLLEDWRARLELLRAGLAEYDRKRDYRFAEEPKGDEQRSWTDVVRRYVGEP
ncbi:MAG: hypothetical protein QOH73_446 [Gaiellaceae bacterium]|nr:hypothetical protein [Gaiellaceae bacterium]